MRYRIRHLTYYRYEQPVTLRHHVLRLRPRSDGAQQLLNFDLK
jgi:transglutaminase-like putative cysteine protease